MSILTPAPYVRPTTFDLSVSQVEGKPLASPFEELLWSNVSVVLTPEAKYLAFAEIGDEYLITATGNYNGKYIKAVHALGIATHWNIDTFDARESYLRMQLRHYESDELLKLRIQYDSSAPKGCGDNQMIYMPAHDFKSRERVIRTHTGLDHLLVKH